MCIDHAHLKPDREYFIRVFSFPYNLFWYLKGFNQSNNSISFWKLKKSDILLQKNTAFAVNANQNATSEIIYLLHSNRLGSHVKDTLKVFEDFKNKQKSVWSKFADMQKYIHSESLFNTLYIEINHKC